tara:strand:- start:1372 stop:1614 length:243 start_codon:yes stop_codon:yes gene_type:complete
METLETLMTLCWDNGVKIYVIPLKGNRKFSIGIEINGKENKDPKKYEKDKVQSKIQEYYRYYFNKHKGKENSIKGGSTQR